jgi:hypothetical protein
MEWLKSLNHFIIYYSARNHTHTHMLDDRQKHPSHRQTTGIHAPLPPLGAPSTISLTQTHTHTHTHTPSHSPSSLNSTGSHSSARGLNRGPRRLASSAVVRQASLHTTERRSDIWAPICMGRGRRESEEVRIGVEGRWRR